MTSRGGLNQSLKLCTEFQALVRIWTFVAKPVRILSRSPDFFSTKEFPDLVRYFRGIGPDLVWILCRSLESFLKIPPNIYHNPNGKSPIFLPWEAHLSMNSDFQTVPHTHKQLPNNIGGSSVTDIHPWYMGMIDFISILNLCIGPVTVLVL